MTTTAVGQGAILGRALADVAVAREAARRRRLRSVAVVLGTGAGWLWLRLLLGRPVGFGAPSLGPDAMLWLPGLGLCLVLVLVIAVPMALAGRSPHVLYRSSEIAIGMDDVRGAGIVKEEVTRTLDLFLAYRTFRDAMGGTPRRAILFEGPPGTGKTYMAKAMAREAGVPFLFVSSSAFQSMYYGQTNRKIRSYFKALRMAARKEGGAIGFIEEIDAIGGARSGMGGGGREGVAGVVNELLIQLQSFDEPTRGDRLRGVFVDAANRYMPAHRQFRKPVPVAANVLVVGATNRAADLDPALLRPGRFDRAVYFGLPGRSDRRDIIDYYLAKKAHDAELDDPARRDTLAAMTAGYSPVMLEHLFDEALVWALRRGADGLDWHDLQQAKMTEEIGLKQPVEYTPEERRRIATHEAGHATVAHAVGTDRKLEVLSIIKRRDALGLLAHSEREERFTKTRSEIVALVQIAMGGMVAEELAFGEAGTGPAGDLQAATTAAAQMVGSLGMGDSLVSFDAAAYPGAANLVAKVLGDESARAAVEDILEHAKAEARRILVANRHVAEALRDALLERDELVGDEILEVIAEAEVVADPAMIDLTSDLA
ncbi:MAG: ATP-dependent Zn protease [Actinomycetia bacterium]|nr:ATP-dependent Zn protease [Actinomycetes bacterium]